MTISTTTATKQYSGDGSTVSFPTVFKFLANADVQITHRDSSDTETVWVEDTQYTLTGAGVSSGGTVTVKTSPTDYTPASGETITIERITADTQGTEYPEGGTFPAKAHETALDRLTMLVQQATAKIARSLKFPVTDASTLSSEIPNSTDRASKFLAFDSSGGPIASTGPTGDSSIPVSSYIETLLDDTSAAAARTTLGAQEDVVTTRGDTIRGDSSGDAERLALGSNEQVLVSDGTDAGWGDVPFPKNHIEGLWVTKSAADVIAVTAGEARDAGDAAGMTLAAFTKDVSSAWAVGTGNGSLDTGSYTGSTRYAVWLIRRSDTSVVDILSSESFSSPTMPTNYDQKRLISFFNTDSGPDIIAQTQIGDYIRFIGDVIADVSDTIADDTYETAALSVPPNCLAHIYANLADATSNLTDANLHVRTTGAADGVINLESWATVSTSGTFDGVSGIGMVLVNGSSQVDYTATEGSGDATVTLRTLGCLMLTRSNPI